MLIVVFIIQFSPKCNCGKPLRGCYFSYKNELTKYFLCKLNLNLSTYNVLKIPTNLKVYQGREDCGHLQMSLH